MNKRKVVPINLVNPSPLQCLDIPEVASLLAVGCTTVYSLIDAGHLETIKVARARRILASSVLAYIQQQRKAG